MNIIYLKTFMAVVETGSFVRASEVLFVTQSTITTRISTLEEELGQKLFHRIKSGTELTSAGFKFQRYAQLMIDAWKQAKQEITLPDGIQEVVNIGCHHELWEQFGRKIALTVKQEYNNIALSIWSGNDSDFDHWFSTGLLDAAITYAPKIRDIHLLTEIYKEELILVATQERERMDWDPNYVYVDAGKEYRVEHAKAYQHCEMPKMTFSNSQWARDYLLSVGGSAYLPKHQVEDDLKCGKLYIIQDVPSFFRPVFLVSKSKNIKETLLSMFKDYQEKSENWNIKTNSQ